LPEAPEIHNTLGAALRAKGDLEGARAELQEAARLNKIKTNRQSATFALNTGLANLKAGKIDDAIVQFNRVIELMPDHPEGYYNLAQALKLKGQTAAAQAAYQKAKKINPNIKPL
jgi:tetratricopeptide (TPR) repeat protein